MEDFAILRRNCGSIWSMGDISWHGEVRWDGRVLAAHDRAAMNDMVVPVPRPNRPRISLNSFRDWLHILHVKSLRSGRNASVYMQYDGLIFF